MLRATRGPRTLFRNDRIQVDDERWTFDHDRLTRERHAPDPWIVLPRRGLYTKFTRGREVVADGVAALFYDEGETFRYRHHSRAGACTYLQLDEDTWREVLACDDAGIRFRAAAASPDSAVDRLHHSLLRSLRTSGEVDPLAVEEVVLVLVRRLVGRPEPACSTHRDEVAEAKRYLRAQRERRPTLSDVARATGLSQYHLARAFRRETGLPLHGYLTRCRIAGALERMRDPGVDTETIAAEFGFANRSHFSRTFSRIVGVSPQRYRTSQSAQDLRELASALSSSSACRGR